MILKLKKSHFFFKVASFFFPIFLFSHEKISGENSVAFMPEDSSYSLIYDAIARENLKTLTALDMELKASEIRKTKFHKKWHEVLIDTLNHHLNLETKEKRQIIFMLFSEYEKLNPFTPNTVLDPVSWQDLELLCGPKSDPSHYIAAKIDRTVTEAGRAVFFKKIIEPSSDQAILKSNQEIIKELYSNEILFAAFEAELMRFQKAESAILSLWQEDTFHDAIKQDELNIPGAKRLSRYVNHSPKMVEMNSYTRLGSFTAANGLMIATAVVLPVVGIAKYNDYDLTKLINFSWLKPEQNSILNQALIGEAASYRRTAAWSFFGISFGLLHSCIKLTEPTMTKVNGVEHVILGPLTGYPALFFPDYMHYVVSLRFCLQTKLIHTAQYIDSLKKLAKIVQSSPILKERCPELARLDNELEELGKKSKKIEQMLALLKTNTFKGKASFFSWYGRINVAYQLLHDVKNILVHPMMVIGELDAYMSCVRLMKEFNEKNIPICFPTYLEEITPTITIEDFWNPSIVGSKAITNSLTLGINSNPKNIIVTGPNAGGKSTTMKGLFVNIVLAQTFGIATARSLTFTPFTKIITYLNITDDIAAGKSHFKAGACRAREVIKTAESVSGNEFSLTAVDEVFNGTTFYEGEAAAYALIEQLSTYPNNICVTITHFPQVPLLEKEYPERFANYKVTVSFDPDGTMKYPYKIQQGISHQNIALDILKTEGFNDTFLTKAMLILAHNPEFKEIK